MQDLADIELLRRYARGRSDEAFAALAGRYMNLVYSAAFRKTGSSQAAEEISQAVFILLARKAHRLNERVVLSGWLYHTTRLTTANYLRTEARRARREQEAYMQSLDNQSEPGEVWPQIRPLLEDAMGRLGENDRNAIVLRFFEGRSFSEISGVLGASENAAKKRVSHALEKLRGYFAKRGVNASTATLGAAISMNSVQAAPWPLAKTATAAALGHGGAVAGSTVASLVKGGFKLAAWTKAQTAAALTAAVILTTGTTTAWMLQSQTRGGVDLPAAGWKFAGYGTPDAAVETLAWAVIHGEGGTLFGSLSPACQQEFRELTAQTKPGVSVEKFLLETWGPELKERTGMRILKTEVLWTNQVLLDVAMQGGKHGGGHWLKVRLVGDEWKLDDFDPKGKNGRTGLPHPNATYGGIGAAVAWDEKTRGVKLVKIMPNSPAGRAGLAAGQVIRSINGTPTAGKTPAECIFLSRGRAGTTVLLGLFQPETGETNMVELTRQRFAR
jgi:RNA polymerase sigma factor (sigma-70 family)